ncbi:hypothetical protein ACH4L5_07400 [Streptomyces sp. NPDC017405]|uniref:hypothetical protein n=1 Tax=unclassified Streptomyces TaxID=2593676 RepID=UPI00379D783B
MPYNTSSEAIGIKDVSVEHIPSGIRVLEYGAYGAKMKITAPPKDTVRECRFAYEQGGQAYTQTLDCELELKVSG